jgi:hypothetical protein
MNTAHKVDPGMALTAGGSAAHLASASASGNLITRRDRPYAASQLEGALARQAFIAVNVVRYGVPTTTTTTQK